MAIGDYTKTAYVTGDVITDVKLNNNENKTLELDTAALELDTAALQASGFASDLAEWYGNTKLGAMFQTDETWVSVSGTQSVDAVNYKLGSQSLKILENDNTGGWLSSSRSGMSLDFSKLNNGETSGTSDYVYICVYISDITKVHADGLNIDLGADVSNYYSAAITIAGYSLVTGWNFIKVLKSSFTPTGGPDWANIAYMEIYWQSADNAINAYVSFQLIQLYKKDPDSAAPNAMQRFGARNFAKNSGEWFVGLESGEIVVRDLNPTLTGITATAASLLGTKAYTNFTAYMKQTIKTVNNASQLVWEIDANNRIGAYLSAGVLYLFTTVAGVNSLSISTAFTCAVGDTVEFVLRRSGTIATLQGIKNGDIDNPALLIKTVSFASVGYLGVGCSAAIYANIQSLSITTTDHAHHANVAETIRQKATDAVSGIVELATDAETLTGTDTERTVTPAGVRALFTPFSYSGALSDGIAASGTLTKTFSLGSTSYKYGEVTLESGKYGIHVTVTDVNTESFVQGIAISLGTDLFGSAWSRDSKNYITGEHSTGSYTLGYLATGTYAVSVDECYINGSNLQLDFVNNTASSDVLSCDLNFRVW
jgi:hypothetical protein